MIVVGIVAAAAATWVISPFVVMNRRGTVAQQHLEAIREETRRLEAARRREEPAVTMVVPAPRRSLECVDGAMEVRPRAIAD